ncbi:MAG: hypothetical protein M0R03_10985 [Novosphingobium sp.]|nr:hypothetical protein [Novosphingobium sp.]
MSTLTPEQRIQEIKRKIEELNTKKIQAGAQLEVLQKQYNEKLQELKALGIEDLNNIPQTITNLQNELNTLLSQAEINIIELETSLTQLEGQV